MCVIYGNNVGETEYAKKEWLSECDDYRIVATANSTILSAVPEGKLVNLPQTPSQHAWQRLRGTIRQLYAQRLEQQQQKKPLPEYYAFGGDDAFVIVNNLRMLLRERQVTFLQNSKAPLLLGHRMVQSGSSTAFVSTGFFILNDVVLHWRVHSTWPCASRQHGRWG